MATDFLCARHDGIKADVGLRWRRLREEPSVPCTDVERFRDERAPEIEEHSLGLGNQLIR